MLEDLIDLQKEKIGNSNSVEELLPKINQLYSLEEQKEKYSSIKRSVQDLGKLKVSPWNTLVAIIFNSYVHRGYK